MGKVKVTAEQAEALDLIKGGILQPYSIDEVIREKSRSVFTGRLEILHYMEPNLFAEALREGYEIDKKEGYYGPLKLKDAEERPPQGLKPKLIHDTDRFIELKEAMGRYLGDDRALPLEWIEEYNDLRKAIQERGEKQ